MHDIQLIHGKWSFSDREPLGNAGGFGEVFNGRSSRGEEVAIKRLFEKTITPRECEIASALIGKSHSYLIPVYDAGQDKDGMYYIVMAKATQNMDSLISKNPNGLPESEVAILCRAIVGGLKELHGARFVHRDLKPANVLMHNGIWKLADFGISRNLSKATSINTLKDCLSVEYAAPEQWQGAQVGEAADIYAVGCIIHTLLTGKPPFNGPTENDFRRQHLYEPPSVIKASSPFLQLVTGCLAKEPESRPNIDMVDNMLCKLLSPTENEDDDLLAKVGAKFAQEALVHEAHIAQARDKRKKRVAIADEARRVLLEIRNVMIESIIARAPTLEDDKVHGVYRLGGAYLRFDMIFQFIEEGTFGRSGWDVITGAKIEASQGGHKYAGRSANLWFMKMKKEDPYRWWEIAYMQSPLIARVQRAEPFGWDQPGGLKYADEAGSTSMGAYQHAANPKTIDGDDRSAFCRRWRDFFALASVNQLECPRNLPED